MASDLALALALTGGERTLGELHAAVREIGLADASAAMTVHTSPIPRRIGHSRYTLAF